MTLPPRIHIETDDVQAILDRKHIMTGMVLSIDGRPSNYTDTDIVCTGLELAQRIELARKHIAHLEQAIRNCQALMLARPDEAAAGSRRLPEDYGGSQP